VLSPLGPRVRYWGHQRDVAKAYRALDYLLTGLPEREALGLNAIESCLAGTPVLAIAAPPFSETMREGVTGFLYTDPRRDGGADFERVLAGVESGELRPDRDAAKAYLDAFSLPRFADRLGTIMEDVASAAAAKRTFPV
jgi:glycosyltransferase involved in cell wall biosynthesis